MARCSFSPARFSRQLFVLLLVAACAAIGVTAYAADRISGTVVDQNGGVILRAEIAVVDAKGTVVARTLTDARGHFVFDAVTCASSCHVEATLVGFETAQTPLPAPGEIRFTLKIAPIQEKVVASATRDDVPTSQIGATTTVYDAADIERLGARVVTDLLRTAPGATVVQTGGGMGNQTSLFVRGGESSYNKVLLDGIPLNEPGGTFNFSDLTTNNIDRVELVQGAQSALFGSDAMSSVVQLFTKRADPNAKHPSVSFDVDGGTYGTRSATGAVSGATGRFDYSFSGSRLHTDNREPNNKFDNTTASGTAGIDLGGGRMVRFVGRVEDGNVGTPGQVAFGRPDSDAFFNGRSVTFGTSYTADHGTWTEHATYSIATQRQISTDLFVDPPYTPTFGASMAPFQFSDFTFNDENDLRRHHASYQADLRIGTQASGTEQILTAAIDYDGERGVLIDKLANTVINASRNNFGLTLQHQLIVHSNVFVTTGVRLEHNQNFGNAATPRVSVAYLPRVSTSDVGTTKLKANFGLGIKEPTLLQSFSPSPFFLGNPALLPEKSRSYDLGIEQWFFREKAKVEFVWFNARYRNQITTVTTNPQTFAAEYFNINLTTAKGAEFQVDLAPVKHLRVTVSHTLTISCVGEMPCAPTMWALRRPRHSGFGEVAWTGGQLTLNLTTTFTGLRVDSDFSSLIPPLTTNGPQWIWSTGGRYKITPNVAAFGRVDNLTDLEYMDPLGYPAWRRSVSVGMTFKY